MPSKISRTIHSYLSRNLKLIISLRAVAVLQAVAVLTCPLLTAIPMASAAPTCLRSLAINRSVLPLVSRSSTAAVLDFDGDGLSDLTSVIQSNSKTSFNILNSSDNTAISVDLAGGEAVPGDYDGDGKWDTAVARKSARGIVWTINLSSSREKVTRTIGNSSSSLISGCHFLSSARHSLATFDGRKLVALEIGSQTKRAIVFTKLSRSVPIGCGDATGDGIDELIIKSPNSSTGSDEVSTVSCVNDNVDYGSRGTGINLFVLDTGSGQIPAVGFERLREKGAILLRFNPLYDSKRYPNFYLPVNSSYTFGSFIAGDLSSGLGVLWKNAKTGVVTRQLFSQPAIKETIATLQNGSLLVKPQVVINNSDITD